MPHNYKAQRAFEELIDGINYYPKLGRRLSWRQVVDFPDTHNYWIKNVVGVSFYRYLVIVEKGHNPEDNKYLRRMTGAETMPLSNVDKIPRALKLDQRRAMKKFLRLVLDSDRRYFIKKSEARPSGFLRAARERLFR